MTEVSSETRAAVAFMDSLPPNLLVELLRRAPDSADQDLATWARRCNPAAATLGPAHWHALRHVILQQGIPGLEALAAVKNAWRRLVESQTRAIVLSHINASANERTRGLLRRPDLVWRIDSAVRRLLLDTGAKTPNFNLVVLECVRAARSDRYCGVWRDVYGAFVAMEEFEPVRAQAHRFANAVLDNRIKTGSIRVPGTPMSVRL